MAVGEKWPWEKTPPLSTRCGCGPAGFLSRLKTDLLLGILT